MPAGGDDAAHGLDEPPATIAQEDDAKPTLFDRPPRTSAPKGRGSGAPVGAVPKDRPTRDGDGDSDGESSASIAGGSVHSPNTVISPVLALAHAEVLRTRTFAAVGMTIGIAGGLAIALLPGEPIATTVMLIAIAITIVDMVYLLYRTRHPDTFHVGYGVAIGWYVPALVACASVPYFGPYSPVPILLVLGVYVLAMGASFRVSLAIYLTCAFIQAAIGSLSIFGIADPGFVKGQHLTLLVQIVCQVLVQVVLVGSFVIARASRRSSLSALAELERAVRAVAQREALLEEAREELRGALGRSRGRFTELTVGRWKLGDVIGRGAMGEVYEAVDAAGENVAIKMLAHSSLGNPHHVQRFLRELDTAKAIESPNVVRVIEIGESPLPHLVMERLRGHDLAAILRDKRPLSHARVVDLVRQIGDGITAAGAVGVIHRDLKPQNLFLAGATWKVLDFGVSRLAEATDTLTVGHVVGTPAYMAPEQARGGTVDHRTDLYALAAIAFRVLTGHAPFSGSEVAEVLYRVVHTPPPRPTSLANVPPDVDLVLAIGLAKNSEARFATAAAFATALAAALDGTLDDVTRAAGLTLVAAGAWARAKRVATVNSVP